MDSEYEDFSSVTTDNNVAGLCSPAGIGQYTCSAPPLKGPEARSQTSVLCPRAFLPVLLLHYEWGQVFCIPCRQLLRFPWQRRISLRFFPQVLTTAFSDPEDPETLPLGGADLSGEDPPHGSAGLGSPLCVSVNESVCHRWPKGDQAKVVMFGLMMF